MLITTYRLYLLVDFLLIFGRSHNRRARIGQLLLFDLALGQFWHRLGGGGGGDVGSDNNDSSSSSTSSAALCNCNRNSGCKR